MKHTLVELARMEQVRRYMLENDIVDMVSFQDYLRNFIMKLNPFFY